MRGLGMRAMAAVVLLVAVGARAGSLDSPAAPTSAGSAMYTVEDLYDRLDTGAAGVKRTGPFTEPAAGPGSTGRTLDEVMTQAPTVDAANGATADQVLDGTTFWGLTGGQWGPQTGTMADNGAVVLLPGEPIPVGFHDGTGHALFDPHLSSANIRAGENIYGFAGDANVVNTSSGDATAAEISSGKKAWVDGAEVTGTASPAPVAKTGQATSYATGDDGDVERGAAWPSPRFTDNGNGTVTDKLTGLIWLKNANFKAGTRTWAQALTDCATLNSGEGGLTDSSVEGDWRLPNVHELRSLIDYGRYNPALCNAAGTGQWTAGDPFIGVVSQYFWSSTAYAGATGNAWFFYLYDGFAGVAGEDSPLYVWPVRGP